jgi:hypothetical protein
MLTKLPEAQVKELKDRLEKEIAFKLYEFTKETGIVFTDSTVWVIKPLSDLDGDIFYRLELGVAG